MTLSTLLHPRLRTISFRSSCSEVAGFALGKVLHVDPRGLGRVVFYVFSPVLIFDLLIKNQLNLSEAAGVIAFTISIVLTRGSSHLHSRQDY
jgi:predicted permease